MFIIIIFWFGVQLKIDHLLYFELLSNVVMMCHRLMINAVYTDGQIYVCLRAIACTLAYESLLISYLCISSRFVVYITRVIE